MPSKKVFVSGSKSISTLSNEFLENGKIHSCAELAKGLTGREFQYVKDIEMCKDCDYGIALWDSKSAGTGENIKRLHAPGKEMKVCYSSLNNRTVSMATEANSCIFHGSIGSHLKPLP